MTEKIRHKGRLAQTGIYLGKFLRMFIFQSDWKVLPMAAIIAGVVSSSASTARDCICRPMSAPR